MGVGHRSGSIFAAGQRLGLPPLGVIEPKLFVAAGGNTILVQAPRGSVRLILADDTHLVSQRERPAIARSASGGDEQDVGERALFRNPFEIAHHVRFNAGEGRVGLEPGQESLDRRDRDVAEDQALSGVLLWSPAEPAAPVLGDQVEVPGVHVRIGRDDVTLPQPSAETLFDRDLLARPHLVGGGDQQAVGVRTDIKTEILRAQAVAPHPLDLLSEFLGGFRDMGIPVDGVA